MKLSNLLTPNLSVNQVWVDFFDSMETALNQHVFNPALNLAKLQNSFNYDEVAVLTLQENGDLLSASDLDEFERALLLLLSDDIGFHWENNTYLTNDDYTRILRYLARYWAVSQTPEFVRFMSFVFNGLFTHKLLWTEDYRTFKSGDEVLVNALIYKDYWANKKLMYSTPRTNLFLYSSGLDNAYWTKNLVTVTPDALVGPDGTTTVDLCIPDAVSGVHTIVRSMSLTAGVTYTFSTYIKNSGLDNFALEVYSATEFAKFKYTFLLEVKTTSGGILTSSSSSHLADHPGWHRFTLTVTPTITQSFDLITHVQDGVFTGDGVSGIYKFGMQCEVASAATSLIDTGATNPAVTDYSISGSSIIFAVPPESGSVLTISNTGNLEDRTTTIPDLAFGYGTGVTTDFTFSSYLRIGESLLDGGEWYPTSHVRLETDMERFGYLPTDILSSFFYYFAPINLVLKEIILRAAGSMSLQITMAGQLSIRIQSGDLPTDTIFITSAGLTYVYIR